MTGWALIGTGRQVQHEMAPAIAGSEQARLVACVGTSTEKAEVVTASSPGAYATDDLDRVLRDPAVDVVYVGSPNGLHHDHVSAALAAGKHVLCDKPLAIVSTQAAELVSTARERGLRLGLVHQLRHHPAHLRARELIGSGQIGEVLSVRVDYGSPGQLQGWRTDKARAGGGVLFNVGVHLVDLVRFLTGSEVARVAARAEIDEATGLDVSLSALLTTTSSASAFVWCSHRAAGPDSRALAVYGTQGSLVAHDSLRLTGAHGPSTLTWTGGPDAVQEYAFPATHIMQSQIDAFDAAVRDGVDPDAGPVDGLAGVLVAEAMLASAHACTFPAVASPDSVLS